MADRSIAHLAQDAAAETVAVATGALGWMQALVERSVNATLDATVPVVASAIVDRIDLKPIVERAISELDLTEVVLQNVDLDAIVAHADLEPIIDRLPLTDLAQYVVDSIDLPAIIRSSTGGIAVDALSATRITSMTADAILGRITDAILLKRRRDTASPLAETMAREAQGSEAVDGPQTSAPATPGPATAGA